MATMNPFAKGAMPKGKTPAKKTAPPFGKKAPAKDKCGGKKGC